MFFPESLYVLSQRDLQVTWLDPIIVQAQSSVAAGTITVNALTVPQDRAFILQAVSVLYNGGAAQNVVRGEIEIFLNVNQPIQLHGQRIAGVANVEEYENWQGSVLLPPSWTLRAEGLFNAGAAVNTVRIAAFGIMIPSGNVQRV